MGKKFISNKEWSKKDCHVNRTLQFSERGFVITVDAFLSVVVTTLLVLLAFFYLSWVSSDSWNVVDLKNIVSDEASVLEKNATFEDSVLRNSSELLEISLNSSPDPYCFEATIFNSSLSPVIHALKAGCSKTATQIISSERTIVVRDDAGSSFYFARVEGWIR